MPQVPLMALIPICTDDARSILRILEVLAMKDGSLTQEQANERADSFGSQCHPRSPCRRWLNLLRNDARRLIELIPVTPPSRFAFKASSKGLAPAFGDIVMASVTSNSRKAKEKKITLNVPASHKIGGYVVTHTLGSINIELMWAETKMDQTGLSCLLVYDGASKEPKELRIAAQRSLSLLFLTLNYVSYVP